MAPWKSGIIAFALVAGLAGPARSQFVAGGARAGGFPAYPGYGATSGYYTTGGGFGNYGLPGAYPAYGGYGLSGYGPGANLGGYFGPVAPAPAPPVAQTYTNMGGLMNSIRTQTGRGNSYGLGPIGGVSRRRAR